MYGVLVPCRGLCQLTREVEQNENFASADFGHVGVPQVDHKVYQLAREAQQEYICSHFKEERVHEVKKWLAEAKEVHPARDGCSIP